MRRILISLSLIFIVLCVIFIYALQNNFLEIFNEPITPVQYSKPENEDPYLTERKSYSKRLERLEIFMQQRLQASDNKDYYLVVSLQDSMLWLDISGVTVHEGAVLGYKLSPDLEMKKHSEEITTWMRSDFYLQEEWATIPKHPIRTKDISGNNMNLDSLDFRPSEIDSTDIYVVFIYTNSFTLGFVQPYPDSLTPPLLEKQISLSAEEMKAEIVAGDTLSFSRLLTGDWILITASPEDIIAVYRALNKSSILVVGI